MIVKWEPYWYELDQSIVVGDIDYFYLSKDRSRFAQDVIDEENYEVKSEILNISHETLGKVNGIIAIGLDYSIYTNDSEVIIIDAEENPGKSSNSAYTINNWNFNVEIRIIEETGISSKMRWNKTSKEERETLSEKMRDRYKKLLNVDSL